MRARGFIDHCHQNEKDILDNQKRYQDQKDVKKRLPNDQCGLWQLGIEHVTAKIVVIGELLADDKEKHCKSKLHAPAGFKRQDVAYKNVRH